MCSNIMGVAGVEGVFPDTHDDMIRLPIAIIKEGIEMKYTFTFNAYQTPDINKLYHVGDEVLVYSKVYNNEGGAEYYYISKEFAAEGYPGNMDKSIKKYHGWRGEYNNVSTYAHGVYTIKSIDTVAGKYAQDEYVKVTINRKDIREGEE